MLLALAAAKFRSPLGINDTSTVKFHVWLTDIDASVMNHAALMTVFECGRIDFMVRTGFFSIARKRKWFFPSSAISVQFFRPLKVFQQAALVTGLFHVTDEFIYTVQKITRNGKDVAVCLAKNKVKSGRENIPVGEILGLMNKTYSPAVSNELIEVFEKFNDVCRNDLSGYFSMSE